MESTWKTKKTTIVWKFHKAINSNYFLKQTQFENALYSTIKILTNESPRRNVKDLLFYNISIYLAFKIYTFLVLELNKNIS